MEDTNRPTPENWNDMAGRYAHQALDNVDREFEKLNLLPLLGQSRSVVWTVLANVARLAADVTAQLQRDGVDTSLAILPPQNTLPPKQNPPSPL